MQHFGAISSLNTSKFEIGWLHLTFCRKFASPYEWETAKSIWNYRQRLYWDQSFHVDVSNVDYESRAWDAERLSIKQSEDYRSLPDGFAKAKHVCTHSDAITQAIQPVYKNDFAALVSVVPESLRKQKIKMMLIDLP
jgi:hypothetical protein